MRAKLIDDFIRNILSVPFCPYHFVHAILSNTILSVYHFFRIPFCPYHFVRYHFVLEPLEVVQRFQCKEKLEGDKSFKSFRKRRKIRYGSIIHMTVFDMAAKCLLSL